MASLADIVEGKTTWRRESTGVTYEVKDVDGYGFQLVKQGWASADPVESMKMLAKVVARSLSIPFDDVFGSEEKQGFDVEECAVIIALATRRVRAVEASASPLSEPAGVTREG